MKKIFLALAFVFSSLSAFSLNRENWSFSVEPLFGLKYGQIDEFVFYTNTKYSDDKLSELNWDIKPEAYYGLKLNGEWKKFFAETALKFGVPMKTGIIADSDWQNIVFSGQENSLYKTNYSESDNALDSDFIFGLKVGYEFQVREIFKIKPAVAFDYQNIKFKGKNGTGWYGNGKSGGGYYAYDDVAHQKIHDFSGKEILTYNRISDYLWIGSDFSVDLPKNFSVTTGFFFAPYVYAISYDSHLLTSVDFVDKTPGYFGAFKWNLGATYNINDRHAFSLNASYFYMRVLRGYDYTKASSADTYKKTQGYEGGAGAKYFDLTLSYRFKIL